MPSWMPPSKRGAPGKRGAGPCSNLGKSSSRTSATTASTRSASRRQRQDMLGHVTGRTRYFDDHAFEGLLHLKVLRSPHPHARIRARSTCRRPSAAPGVKRVIRAADVPVNKNTLLSLINFGKDDEPLLAVDKVRYKGEPIVAVVAESEAAAYDALAKIRVDYDPLPAVFDVEEAIKPGAPVVNETYPANTFEYHEKYNHQKLRFGDVERAFAAADFVVEERYQMSPIEHAPTETNGSIAAPETNDRFVVHTCTQALFFSLGTAAKLLDVPSNRLHFIGGTVGGGFGGKVDSLTEPLSILGAMLTGRPVRYVLGREEEMLYGCPRGAERHYIKDGVMRDGRIVARKVTSYFDAGAYTRLSSYGAVKCIAHIPGPYTIPNVHADVLLRLHQPHPGHRHARLRHHRRRLLARGADGQAGAQGRHGPDGVPHPQRLPRRGHEGAPARGPQLRADRVRAGGGREGRLADPRRVPAHVLARPAAAASAPSSRRPPPTKRDASVRAGPRRHVSAPRAGGADRTTAARAAARSPRSRASPAAPGPRRPPRRRRLRRAPHRASSAKPRRPRPAARRHTLLQRVRHAQEVAMAKHRGRGMAVDQLPDRHEPRRRPEPGAGAFQPRRQVHRHALGHRPRPGHEAGDAPDRGRDAGRAHRRRLRRHGRLRHRPARHGQLRLARHASRRQRGDGGRQGGARRDDGGRRRGAGGQRRGPGHRRPRQHPRQGRTLACHRGQGRRHRRPVQAGQDHRRPRHLPDPAVRGEPRDRRDEPRLLLRARLPGRRPRGRRRDRRGRPCSR